MHRNLEICNRKHNLGIKTRRCFWVKMQFLNPEWTFVKALQVFEGSKILFWHLTQAHNRHTSLLKMSINLLIRQTINELVYCEPKKGFNSQFRISSNWLLRRMCATKRLNQLLNDDLEIFAFLKIWLKLSIT